MKMENNNLDNLFRNKLKDIKVSPPKDAWETIANKLPKKKKNRVVVLWWAAAAVLLIFFASRVFFWSVSESESQHIEFVDISNEQIEESTKENQKNIIAAEAIQAEMFDSTKLSDSSDNQKYKSDTKFSNSSNKAIADKSAKVKAIASPKTKKKKSATALTESKNKAEIKITNSEKSKIESGIHIGVQEQDVSKSEELKTKSSTNQTTQEKQLVAVEKVVEDQQKVKSLTDINNLLAKENGTDEKSKAKQHGKWSVGPQVAPVYYNSVTGGSSLDSQFNDSSKEGGVNMSLGLQVAYQLNDKWQLRSGVNKVNVGYATNNVLVGYSDPNLAMNNINYQNVPNGEIVITVFSNNNLSEIHASDHGNRVELVYTEGNTQLKQSMTYLEIPIEVERKIIQSDFEWSIIGGVSSLFLTNDDVYVTNKDFTSNIGSASNLEKTSFTTNIGMGFGYNFTKSLHFQVEPMFKYQLNAYTNSVDFKPYIFGVYTGIRWKIDQ